MTGSSSESVTRLFARFNRQRLVKVRGSTVIMANKVGLEKPLDG